MNLDHFTIRELQYLDIPQLKYFAPGNWGCDLTQFYTFHFGQHYFYPIVAEFADKIVGCGCCIINGNAGWLGNIIVVPELRRQGIGIELTRHLVSYLREKGITAQLLIATKMGEPVYSKLDFKTVSMYIFYKCEKVFSFERSKNIREINRKDYPLIKLLDIKITDEIRSKFIERFFSTGYVYESHSSKEIEGFYLPDLGGGLVIARNKTAGLNLLKFKLSRGQTTIVIPEANTIAKDFLINYGFQENSSCPRMVLGKDVNWNPERVFSRGSGYSG